jgi:hypothetical protein
MTGVWSKLVCKAEGHLSYASPPVSSLLSTVELHSV